MTIVVASKTSEGLIFGSDSAVSLTTSTGDILNIYEYGEKLYPLEEYPIGILSWGVGSIGNRSIKSLISEFGNELAPASEIDEYRVEKIAEDLFNFLRQRHLQERVRSSLGIIIGGYSTHAFFPEEYIFVIPGDEGIRTVFPDLNGKPVFGSIWKGVTKPITRVLYGFDPDVIRILKANQQLSKQEKTQLEGLQYYITSGDMPLQDGIDLVKFLVGMVVGITRFSIGAPTCGGHIDIAVVTREGFKWVTRKELRG